VQATADKLTSTLGTRSAGSFIDAASGGLVVNVLDAAAAAQVRASGAEVRMVSRSLARLDQIKASLDRLGGPTGTAWAVDVQSNTVVLSVPRGGAGASTAALLARARSFGSSVRVERTAGHCTDIGSSWTTSSGLTIGPTAASSFPGNDFGASASATRPSSSPRAACSTTARS
jgi:hypothetical protein